MERSKEVEDAISSVFKTIQKWQNNVDPTDAGDFPSEYRSVMVKKLKSNNEVLTKALQETKTEMDEIKRREEEAAEEVKRSLQVEYRNNAVYQFEGISRQVLMVIPFPRLWSN